MRSGDNPKPVSNLDLPTPALSMPDISVYILLRASSLIASAFSGSLTFPIAVFKEDLICSISFMLLGTAPNLAPVTLLCITLPRVTLIALFNSCPAPTSTFPSGNSELPLFSSHFCRFATYCSLGCQVAPLTERSLK